MKVVFTMVRLTLLANHDKVQLHSNTLGFRRCINVGVGVISNFIADGVLRLELRKHSDLRDAPRYSKTIHN